MELQLHGQKCIVYIFDVGLFSLSMSVPSKNNPQLIHPSQIISRLSGEYELTKLFSVQIVHPSFQTWWLATQWSDIWTKLIIMGLLNSSLKKQLLIQLSILHLTHHSSSFRDV